MVEGCDTSRSSNEFHSLSSTSLYKRVSTEEDVRSWFLLHTTWYTISNYTR